MRLLPKNEVASRLQEQKDNQIIQAKRITRVLDAKTKELNDTKNEYSLKVAQMNLQFLQETEEIDRKRKALEAEIAGLERKRDSTLAPIQTKIKELHTLEKEIDEKIKDIEKREKEVETFDEEVRESMLYFASQKDKIEQEEEDIKQARIRLTMEQNVYTTSNKNLTLRWQEYYEKEKNFTEHFNNLQRKLTAEQTSVAVLKEEYEKRMNNIGDEMKRLESRRSALNNAYAEAKERGII